MPARYQYLLQPSRLPDVPWRRMHATYHNALAEAHRIIRRPGYRPSHFVVIYGPDLPEDGKVIRTTDDR